MLLGGMSSYAPAPFYFRHPPAVDVPLSVMSVDLETSGLNQEHDGRPHGRNTILQIGAVDLPTGLSFYGRCRPRPGAEINPEAMAVNGITPAELADSSLPTEGELLQAFTAWVRTTTGQGTKRMLGGMNPRFDLEFLKSSMRHAGMDPQRLPLGRRTVAIEDLCVAEAYRRAVPIPEAGFATDKCYLLLGLPCEPKPHNAYVGALYGARCLDELHPKSHRNRFVDLPTRVGADYHPGCLNPFLVSSLRLKFDTAADGLRLMGGPAAQKALLDIPTVLDAEGQRVCANPAFTAHYAGLVRLASRNVHAALGYGFSKDELSRQATAVNQEWAQMDQAVKDARKRERSAPPARPVSEADSRVIGGLVPPDTIDPSPAPAAPGLALSTP